MSQLDRYFLRSPATDMFRRIRHLEVDIGGGLTIPIDKVVEEEARARCERILRGHVEAVNEQANIRERIKASMMEHANLTYPPDIAF